MRLDRSNPKHLLIAVVGIMNSAIALMLRPFVKRSSQPRTVLFVGHTLNGNLKPIYERLKENSDYEPFFLGINEAYVNRLKKTEGERALLATSIKSILPIARASAAITSHGVQTLWLQQKFSGTKFIDVWHGIPYKGFDHNTFKPLHDYDQVWVSSDELKEIYSSKFGFQPARIHATGYPRVDGLVNKTLNRKELIAKYSLPFAKKYILVAPTWQQDDKSRAVVPFGVSNEEFFSELDKVASKHSAHVIFRTHLNSGDEIEVPQLRNTSFMPYARYEQAEEFLFIADMLVSDWSSISFDFLPLDRPTIFLDVKAPFELGFTLGTEYRFGEVVSSFAELLSVVDMYLGEPEQYLVKHKLEIQKAKSTAYGNTLDGQSAKRCEELLRKLLDSKVTV